MTSSAHTQSAALALSLSATLVGVVGGVFFSGQIVDAEQARSGDVASLALAVVAGVAGLLSTGLILTRGSGARLRTRVPAPLWEANDPKMAHMREIAFDTLMALPHALNIEEHARGEVSEAWPEYEEAHEQLRRLRLDDDVPDEVIGELLEKRRELSEAMEGRSELVRRQHERVLAYIDRLADIREQLLKMGYSAEAGDLGDSLRDHLSHTHYWDRLAQQHDDVRPVSKSAR